MKPFFLALLLLGLVPVLPAQDVPANSQEVLPSTPSYTREELLQLLGPIALYPDPLVGLILPASTFPSDIVLAARFVETGDDLSVVDDKAWDVSVRALTRYPDVLKWMDENLEWTTQLGLAYLAQPNDVMDVIQELRGKAQEVGNLVDTPQQRVVREEQYIRIVPTEPDYVYAPYYDPEVVYYERAVDVPLMTFGPRWTTGWWLSFDFDWHRHRLYCGDWDGGWDYHNHHDRYDRYDYHGDRVCINERLTNYRIWEGDRHRRLGSDRSFANVRSRQRGLVNPEPLRERRELSSKVAKQLTRQDDRWSKRAVSSGLAKNSVVDRPSRPGKGGSAATDDLVGKGRRDGDSKDRMDEKGPTTGKDRIGIPGRGGPNVVGGPLNQDGRDGGPKGKMDERGPNTGKDRITIPKAEAPNVVGGPLNQEGKDRGPKGKMDERGPNTGKDRITIPKAEAPNVVGGLQGKDRKDVGSKGNMANRGPSTGSDRIVIPKGEAPRIANVPGEKNRNESAPQRPDSKKMVPTPNSAPLIGSGGKGPSLNEEEERAKDRDRGRTKVPLVASTPRPQVDASKAPSANSSAGKAVKPSAGPSVQKSPPRPSPRPSSSVQKSAPKPKPIASAPPRPATKSKPSGPPTVKKNSPPPRPSVAKSAPKPQPKVMAKKSAPKPQPKVMAKKSAPPRPKISNPPPRKVSPPRVSKPASKPSASKPKASPPRPSAPVKKAAPAGGSSDKKKKKK